MGGSEKVRSDASSRQSLHPPRLPPPDPSRHRRDAKDEAAMEKGGGGHKAAANPTILEAFHHLVSPDDRK